MSVARTLSIALRGLDGTVVEVETDIGQGLPAFVIVGLPDSSTLQARERVRGACTHVGHKVAQRRVTVNLTPAWIPKQGSGFDLAIAMSCLASLGAIDRASISSVVFLGELTLDGAVRPVPGVLPAVMAAAETGVQTVVVPAANCDEAKLHPGVDVIPAEHLADVVVRFGGRAARLPSVERFAPTGMSGGGHAPCGTRDPGRSVAARAGDYSEVVGQSRGIHAAQIAAAGGHHLLLIGPPGAGKTMIASRLPTILPDLDDATALDLSAVASVAGVFESDRGLIRTPPFVAPHHTASASAVIGGGSGIAVPGAVSRAHGGVLFLDEAPEFSPRVLEALREPLESGDVALHRARGVATYPARFQLVLAANPCPCGRAFGKGDRCTCSSLQKRRYMSRLSGPIVDRVDLRISLPPARPAMAAERGPTSQSLRDGVDRARRCQRERFAGTGISVNAHAAGDLMRDLLPLAPADEKLLVRAVERGGLTMRGRDRVRRIAWTVADLADHDAPISDDVSTALELRGADIT